MLGNHNYRLNINPLVVSQNDKGLLDAAALAGSIYDFVAKNSKEKKAAEERQKRWEDLRDMYLNSTTVPTTVDEEPINVATLDVLLGGDTGYRQPLEEDDQYRKYLNLFGGNNG